jgi:hypothetical protein
MAQMPGGQRRASDNGMPVMPSAASGDRRGADSRGDNGRRPATGPNQRRSSNGRPQRPDQGNAPARPRPVRGKRSEDTSEWDSSEWDKLSDVDYWATLASEKPLSTPKPAPERRPERPDRPADVPPSGRRPARAGAPRRDPATGLPVRSRPPAPDADLAPAAAGDYAAAPVPVSGARAVKGLLELSDPGGPHTGPSDLPDLSRGMPEAAPPPPPAVLDNDPLTSPSFPRVPASDSRSYRNSRTPSNPRTATPPGGSPVPDQPYSAPTQQLPSYGPAAAQFPGHGGDAQLTNPYAYPSGPVFQDPYAPAGGNGSTDHDGSAGHTAATGNPYGSYVTPDSQTVVSSYGGYSMPDYSAADYQAPEYPDAAGHGAAPDGQTATSAYGDYAGTHGNGHGSYPPPAGNGANDYWTQQATVPGVPGQDTPGYPDNSGQDYGNGYGQQEQAAYPPEAYPAGSQEQAGYAPLDPYGPDVYGSYPGYGTPGR